MWLTRPAFWYLPDLRFGRYLSDFGPNLDPHSLARLLDVRAVAPQSSRSSCDRIMESARRCLKNNMVTLSTAQ
jgi:hypothetical protein